MGDTFDEKFPLFGWKVLNFMKFTTFSLKKWKFRSKSVTDYWSNRIRARDGWQNGTFSSGKCHFWHKSGTFATFVNPGQSWFYHKGILRVGDTWFTRKVTLLTQKCHFSVSDFTQKCHFSGFILGIDPLPPRDPRDPWEAGPPFAFLAENTRNFSAEIRQKPRNPNVSSYSDPGIPDGVPEGPREGVPYCTQGTPRTMPHGTHPRAPWVHPPDTTAVHVPGMAPKVPCPLN